MSVFIYENAQSLDAIQVSTFEYQLLSNFQMLLKLSLTFFIVCTSLPIKFDTSGNLIFICIFVSWFTIYLICGSSHLSINIFLIHCCIHHLILFILKSHPKTSTSQINKELFSLGVSVSPHI